MNIGICFGFSLTFFFENKLKSNERRKKNEEIHGLNIMHVFFFRFFLDCHFFWALSSVWWLSTLYYFVFFLFLFFICYCWLSWSWIYWSLDSSYSCYLMRLGWFFVFYCCYFDSVSLIFHFVIFHDWMLVWWQCHLMRSHLFRILWLWCLLQMLHEWKKKILKLIIFQKKRRSVYDCVIWIKATEKNNWWQLLAPHNAKQMTKRISIMVKCIYIW